MSLTAGTKLGPCEIFLQVKTDGAGQIYPARYTGLECEYYGSAKFSIDENFFVSYLKGNSIIPPSFIKTRRTHVY